jgi:hypothetical protein
MTSLIDHIDSCHSSKYLKRNYLLYHPPPRQSVAALRPATPSRLSRFARHRDETPIQEGSLFLFDLS